MDAPALAERGGARAMFGPPLLALLEELTGVLVP
jgi:hypothetical protein